MAHLILWVESPYNPVLQVRPWASSTWRYTRTSLPSLHMKKITNYKTRFLVSHLEPQDWRSSIALWNSWKVLPSWLANCGPCLLPQRTQVSHLMSHFSVSNFDALMQKHSIRSPHLHASCFTSSSEEYYTHINEGKCQVNPGGGRGEASVIEGNVTEQFLWKESSPRLNVDISLSYRLLLTSHLL